MVQFRSLFDFKGILVAIILAAFPFSAMGKTLSSDNTILKNYFSSFVRELQSPIYMWSWTRKPITREKIHELVSNFWQDMCTHSKNDPADCDPNHAIDSWN